MATRQNKEEWNKIKGLLQQNHEQTKLSGQALAGDIRNRVLGRNEQAA